ncbi:hypothetical protein DQX05_26210 [Paenibacillus thiaminolyticus]|uniref:Helix-turn-helix domain-containing protein n=1 Tax=Paenibacillus thiaminolyticus TaxID=49283 RepID=A0A3A3GWH5_PANTH|nr:hypothetical protein DQX05_26210 [Paenibacillus thiaminolyticus]
MLECKKALVSPFAENLTKEQHYIRFLREAEGCSIRDIARQMGIHLRTAKKYADQPNWNESIGEERVKVQLWGHIWRSWTNGWRKIAYFPGNRAYRHTDLPVAER